MQKLLFFALSSCVPAVVTAQASRNYDCTNAGAMRRVEVAYPSGGEVPCEVRYHKEGVPEVLWSAEHQAGYCEAQARDFVARLQGLGWTCTDTGTSPGAAPQAPPDSTPTRDDTDALGAGDSPPR